MVLFDIQGISRGAVSVDSPSFIHHGTVRDLLVLPSVEAHHANQNEPRREKIGFLHMRKQRSRSLRLCFRYMDSTIPLLPKSNRKAMNRNWSNQKANPALKTKAGNK